MPIIYHMSMKAASSSLPSISNRPAVSYHRYQREIGAKLEAINAAMIEHSMKKPLEKMDWADCGDLAKISADLDAILEFLK